MQLALLLFSLRIISGTDHDLYSGQLEFRQLLFLNENLFDVVTDLGYAQIKYI